MDYFLKGTMPEIEPIDVRDSLGRVRLGPKFSNWWRSSMNHLRDHTSLTNANSESINILSPRPGTVIYLDPDLPSSSKYLPLRANVENVVWQSDTLDCNRTGDGFIARLKPGVHELRVDNGRSHLRTWIEVKQQ